LLPEHKNRNAGRLDLLSAILSLASVLPVIFGIKVAAEGGSLLSALLAVLLGIVFGVLFVRRQARLPDPLLDLSLFRRPAMTAALAIYILDFFVGFGILVLVAQYLQLVLGLTPLQAGLWSTPVGFGFVAGSLLTSPALRLMRPAYVIGLGLTLGAGGLAAMALAVSAHSLILVVLGNVLFSIGLAPCTAIIADLVVSSAPQDQSGAASALSETASEFGGALGIALLGSLATFIYRSALSGAMPKGVPQGVIDMAMRGIGSAASLPRDFAAATVLLSAARSAYTYAAQTALLAAASVILLSAVGAVGMFGDRKAQG
jgi:DHA2 family multidrug resistance protein-like MFS transporter